MRQITINDLPVGRSVDETLRLIQAFQFVEKHGEGKSCVIVSFQQNRAIIKAGFRSYQGEGFITTSF